MTKDLPTDNSFMKKIMIILRAKHYTVKKIKINDLLKENTSVPIWCKISQWHTIVVWKNEIYDANSIFTLKLTEKNLNWCSGINSAFAGVLEGFKFYPSPKIAKKLNLEVINNF